MLSQVEKLKEEKYQSEDGKKVETGDGKIRKIFCFQIHFFYLTEGLLICIGVKICKNKAWDIHSISLQAQLETSLILPHIFYPHGPFQAEFMPFIQYN